MDPSQQKRVCSRYYYLMVNDMVNVSVVINLRSSCAFAEFEPRSYTLIKKGIAVNMKHGNPQLAELAVDLYPGILHSRCY